MKPLDAKYIPSLVCFAAAMGWGAAMFDTPTVNGVLTCAGVSSTLFAIALVLAALAELRA